MKKAAAGLLLAGLLPSAQAFSLLGPFPGWQTATIGYQLASDLGGPMNIGEEYRFNFPTITYAFDPSFLNYFGAKGVAEVEKAMAILNALPPFSLMSEDLHEFPLNTRRVNHQAAALYLYDLKSHVLGTMLEQLGLAPAERYVWTLRSRVVINNVPYYSVIQRSFDPVTQVASKYVNGVLYTYQILQTYPTPTWEAVSQAVDPTLPTVTSVSAYSMFGGTVMAPGATVNASPGLFYTGLTRDDVGGLRYLYRRDNYNVSSAPPGAVRAPVRVMEGGSKILDEDSGTPWGPPPFGGTNTVGTNNLPLLSTAIRPGMDKLNFVRVDFDSLVGAWVTVTNRYTDIVITNGVRSEQVVDRVLAAPDILFTASDLGMAGTTPATDARTVNFQNNATLNGNPGQGELAGPGTLVPGQVITFSKLGQSLLNVGGGGEVDASLVSWWGSFDGTTNEPYVYPQGTSIAAIERLVATRVSEGNNPWSAPPLFVVGVASGNTNFVQQGGTIGNNNTANTGNTTGGTTP